MKTLIFALLALSFTGLSPAFADKEKLRGIKGKDDRTLIENYTYPWSAIGRINKEVGGFCTGTLIAPKIVLTAAHCLWHKKRKVWLKPHTIHFLAGYRRGSFIEHSRGEKFVIAPGYDPNKGKRLSVAAKDWALVILKNDMSKQVGTIGLSPVDKNIYAELINNKTNFIQAGYSQDKAHILSINKKCPMKRYNGLLNVVTHSCDAVHGDSGSPIFYIDNGVKKIAYIHVATTKKGTAEGVAVSGVTIAQHLKKLGYWDQAKQSTKPDNS